MKILKLLIISVSLMTFSLNSLAKTSEEETAVRSVVQKYIDGYVNGNVDLLKEAFHPDTVIKFANLNNGKYNTLDMVGLNEFIGNVPDDWSVDSKFYSLDIYGTIASAKVSVTIKIEGGSFTWTDYVSLLKADGKWMIVSKVSHGEGSRP